MNWRNLGVSCSFYFYLFLSLVLVWSLLLHWYLQLRTLWRHLTESTKLPGFGEVLLIWWSTDAEKTSYYHNDAIFSKGTAGNGEKLMANICRELTLLTVYPSLCSKLCQDLLTAALGSRFCHQFTSMYRGRNWGLSKIIPITSGRPRIWVQLMLASACAAFPAAALAKSLHHCTYIYLDNWWSHRCLCWHFTSAVLSFRPPFFPIV